MTLSNWVDIAKIATALLALASFAFALVRYFQVRSREIRWKRTEFIFEQANLIDQDREINFAISVLSEVRDDCDISDIFDIEGKFQSKSESK